jgi:hypothetical protein
MTRRTAANATKSDIFLLSYLRQPAALISLYGSVALTFLTTTCSGQTTISHTTACLLIADF